MYLVSSSHGMPNLLEVKTQRAPPLQEDEANGNGNGDGM